MSDSKIEIIPGTKGRPSGPRPSALHVDEVELMREKTHDAEKMEEVRSSDRGVAFDHDEDDIFAPDPDGYYDDTP